jgi:hypothetical protein
MVEELKKDIEIYNKLMEEFKRLDSSDFTTAYRLSQTALTTADRWNEIMLNSVKYSKEMGITKSEFTNYCYQKFKIIMKAHDFARIIYRQGSYGIQNSFYGEDSYE